MSCKSGPVSPGNTVCSSWGQSLRTLEQKRSLKIPVFPQPFGLGLEVPVNDIAFFILETPWYDKHGIAFAYPGAFLDLSLDPAHAGDPVHALDADVISTEHCLCKSKLFLGPFLWQPHACDRSSVRIHCVWIDGCLIVLFMKTTHSTNYVYTIYGG